MASRTSEPYLLPPKHPIRCFFSGVGSWLARHASQSIVFALALSVAISFPLLLQFRNHASELYLHVPALRSHAWTAAQQCSSDDRRGPDLVLRQVWLHGDFMRAIDLPTLEGALIVQDQLLGTTAGCDGDVDLGDTHGTTSRSFFHSPLLYWGCSLERMRQDSDLLRTINQLPRGKSAVNLTLEPSTVFARKTYELGELVAADALITSLFHEPDSLSDTRWSERFQSLTGIDGWDVRQDDRNESRSWLYELRYQPMSLLDYALFFVCYGFMGTYLVTHFMGLRILRSRLGLISTIIIQMLMSTVTAFSILLLLDIRVSQIPLEAYPFVVLVMGVQSSLRLVHAILQTAPERSTADRIGDALGTVGFLSVLEMAQNLLILRILYAFLNPGLSVFCAFAGLCVILDLFYHFTFFVPCLCVGLRRTDLGELLDNNEHARDVINDGIAAFPFKAGGRETFLEASTHISAGPFSSSRLLGIGLIIGFALLLNQHFTSGTHISRCTSLGSWAGRTGGISLAPSSQSAKATASWLQLQDQGLVRDLVNIIKPESHVMTIRMHEPHVLVKQGANRHSTGEVSEFRGHTSILFAFGLLLIVVAAWRKYFASDASEDEALGVTASDLLSVRSPAGHHGLDVLFLATSPQGLIVSVGLDHRVRVWDMRKSPASSTSDEIPPIHNDEVLWPISAVAVNGRDRAVAILTSSGKLYLWDVESRSFHSSLSIGGPIKKRPCAFFFPRNFSQKKGVASTLLLIGSDGILTEIFIEQRLMNRHKICSGPALSSEPVLGVRLPLRIVTIAAEGPTYVTSKHGNTWTSEKAEFLSRSSKSIGVINGFWPLPSLGLMGVALGTQADEVFLVDLQSHVAIRKFNTGWIKKSTLRGMHSPRRSCPRCGTTSVESFSVTYTEEGTGDLRIHTFVADKARRDMNPWICFRAERDPRERHCAGFERVDELRYRMECPGYWEATGCNQIAGFRRAAKHLRRSLLTSSHISTNGGRSTSRSHSSEGDDMQIRMRSSYSDSKADISGQDLAWECYTMDATGQIETVPIQASNADEGAQLFFSQVGALSQVGRHSVVAALGVTIKLLLVGPERFDEEDEEEARSRPGLDLLGRASAHRAKTRSKLTSHPSSTFIRGT